MGWIKVLCLGVFSAILLVTATSCGVDTPTAPVATAVPADGSTINNSGSIVITFTASMDPGSLTLSGDMEKESNRGVWSRTRQTNDTLTVSPDVASVEWTVGSHTLIVDASATSGAPISTLVLNYTVEEQVPTAVVVPADSSTIIGSDLIVIFFSAAMDPSTLALTGDMAVESKGGIWSTTNNTNDTLVISPSTAWTGAADILIIDVDSVTGVSLPTLTLNYNVDVSVPIATASPADGAAINNLTPIVIYFTIEMNTLTLQPLAGSMGSESDGGVWTSNSNLNDTLTISPVGAWSGGARTLVIDVDASNGIPLPTLLLNYTVDDALPTASLSPVTGSSINSGQSIEIVFSKSMDITTLTASGSLWDSADPNVAWSTKTNVNDTLTISPASSWPVQTIDLTLDILDLVGNSLTIPTQNYIVDVTVPTITLKGSATENVERGTAYTDAGATAVDNIDGDISGNIVVAGDIVDVSTVGVYIITYNVSDAAGNPSVQVTRTVTVTPDVTAPVITVLGANPLSLEAGTSYTELGATATDTFDGDISGDIVIDSSAVNMSVTGDYSVTYNVSDATGNPAVQVTRTVTVTPDVTAPVITLLGANPLILQAGTSYTELGATAIDTFDGDISGNIVIDSSAVNMSAAGDYSVTYNVSDAAGNPAVQVTRTVTVRDVTAPVITLVGANPLILQAGTSYTELGATATDAVDGNISGNIVIDSSAVNMSAAGDYSVTYNVSDAAGNPAVQVTRTVTVTPDVTAPVITLLGANPLSLEEGTSYTELGATATDAVDGNISGNIVIDSSAVIMSAAGDYSVTYNVSDAAGNPAVQVTRTVTVFVP